MRRPVLAATLTAAIALGSAPAMAERTLALVIGIDDYAHIPRLDGAVNDARDIADALRALGAETTLLVDGAATRAAILDAWTRLAGMARPGDRLIVTYAGHGSNEAEATPGKRPTAATRTGCWRVSRPVAPTAANASATTRSPP